MGRRRWRFIAVAAFLLVISRDTACQDENDFYYTPVERSFAQVQPPLYPNNRPATYFENGDSYRLLPQSNLPNTAQQHLFNEEHTRFPSPNYNQHPSPFQLPTGRSQSPGQYYLNQPEFPSSQRQRFRPTFPQNFQVVHPASTRRPDVSQIHSVAYQNDPSKPETFLGQITLNNPDTDFLQSGRYKNTPFDGNSLKTSNQLTHGVDVVEDADNDNQDLFERHRVTTYNPNKYSNKQRLNIKSNLGHISHHESITSEEQHKNSSFNKYLQPIADIRNDPSLNRYNKNSHRSTSTEFKELLDLEPLLEDDISDIPSFRELMKNTQGSFDVQVIKSNDKDAQSKNEYDKYDSNPSASSMNTDNISKEISLNKTQTSKIINKKHDETTNTQADVSKNESSQKSDKNDDLHDAHEEIEDDAEYVEYYDDPESTEFPHTTPSVHNTDHSVDIYDEYDGSDETEQLQEEIKPNTTNTFDVLAMKFNNTMVKDDNFRQFVDTTVIDQSDTYNDTNEFVTEIINSSEELSSEDTTSAETPSILGQEVVSVVTTKSVVNGTISIPDVTYPPSTSKFTTTTDIPHSSNEQNGSSSFIPNTTENWIVVASVQTSRSVSGARFLPFPTVEQEEKKQVLTDSDEDDEEESVTYDPKISKTITPNQQSSTSSTENINDKLDSIQSELSSAVLAGNLDANDKNIAHITESTTENPVPVTSTSTTPSNLNVFTLKSTQQVVVTEKSFPDPLPVLIKKFTPRVTTTSSTTQRPKKKPSFVTVMDDLAGLLPPGYKPRLSFKDKRTSTTTTTTTTPMPVPSKADEDIINGTQGRSSGITSKNKVILLDQKSSLIPKDYKPATEIKQHDDLFKNFQEDDLSKFLPPGYKLPINSTTSNENKKPDILDKIQKVDISAFLPKGYKATAITEKAEIDSKLLDNATPVDISAFLPPGFKLNTTDTKNNKGIINNVKEADITNFLPPGFKLNKSDDSPPISSSTVKPSNGFKVVFPSRPGVKPTRKTTTQKSSAGIGPDPVTPKIQKGWPTRASTEFTGWPSPSTTPFSIEKLLEAQRNATATSPLPELHTEATTRRITTTTTTTPVPPPSTTPGVCRRECDIAATIKIVAGVKWLPELLDHHTDEWKKLAKEVKQELNSVYSKSDLLKKWYKGIRIDAFSQGSVLVDYFVELNNVEERIDTLELKKLFHRSLTQAKLGSVLESIVDESRDKIDSDTMLGDQPDEDRMKKSNEKMTKTIDKSAGKLEIGKFVMDPAYTEFIVLPKREEPTIAKPEEESFLPQWGIAVIVIALASLLFVVIFGVTVLVNRQKSAKAKQPIPLSEDMLRELDKSHMGGFDDVHQLKERDLPYLPSGKRMSTAFIEQLACPNPGDSWRSEWTPQMQKYMQNYTPDSGRGSQIYGTGGNGYGFSGSQLYGQTGGGGGSQVYGYTGEYPRSHFSRRRSDYDSNF